MVDEQTFTAEALAMERTLYRVSRSILPAWEDCADAVQEALTKAWAKRDKPQPEYFRAWLTRIVINECHNLGRKKKRVVLAAEIELAQPSPAPAPDEALREVISTLPERLRMPLLLHHLEGFSLDEVAKMLCVPVGTVKSRLFEARKQLRAHLTEVQE